MWTKLNRRLGNKVKRVQFAVDGNWESAWKIEDVGFNITQEEIDVFLPTHFEHISCELFLEDKNGMFAYIGARYPRTDSNDFNLNWFRFKANALLSSDKKTALNLFDRIQHGLGLLSFTHRELQLIEVGIVDYWKTFGSVVLWQQGETDSFTKYHIAQKLEANPHIQQTSANYHGLEFAFEGEHSYWVGVQLSMSVNGVYQIDESYLHNKVEDFFEGSKE